jgi:hypothetical protein
VEIIFLTRHARDGTHHRTIEGRRWLEPSASPSLCLRRVGSRSRMASALHLDLVIDASADSCVTW